MASHPLFSSLALALLLALPGFAQESSQWNSSQGSLNTLQVPKEATSDEAFKRYFSASGMLPMSTLTMELRKTHKLTAYWTGSDSFYFKFDDLKLKAKFKGPDEIVTYRHGKPFGYWTRENGKSSTPVPGLGNYWAVFWRDQKSNTPYQMLAGKTLKSLSISRLGSEPTAFPARFDGKNFIVYIDEQGKEHLGVLKKEQNQLVFPDTVWVLSKSPDSEPEPEQPRTPTPPADTPPPLDF